MTEKESSSKVKTIPLTRGFVTLVDDQDYPYVIQWKWSALKTGRNIYAIREEKHSGLRMYFYLHRVLLNATSEQIVDHVDRDGLNNQKSNLRIATKSQNGFNGNKHKDNKSGFKGVFFNKSIGKWHAKICRNGKRFDIGKYDNPIEAAISYDRAAINLHGEFACTNKTLGLLDN